MEAQYGFLGLLMRAPNYGYELKKLYDRYFSGDKPILAGQVYATLSRLERDKKVEELEHDENEASGGPARTCYAVTRQGEEALRQWLETPEIPSPTLQTVLYFKTVIALLIDGDAASYIRAQRKAHLQRMRELTARKADARIDELLLIDHAIFHIDADLRWMDLASSRLNQLKEEVWALSF